MSLTRWDEAHPAVRAVDRPGPQVVTLPPGTPSLAELFTFARDAELRFDTLRMRIEERSGAAPGERLVVSEVAIRHPGHARILSSQPLLGTAANYDIWLSDGEVVRTYSARDRKATHRPARSRPRGLDQKDLPGTSRVYTPLTPLASPSLADTLIHPAGLCQNVLSTGSCRIAGTDVVAGREAILVECDHPRTTQLAGDRSDYHLQVAFDRIDGVITRLVESLGGALTREVTVTAYDPDVDLPDSTFELTVPEGTNLIY